MAAKVRGDVRKGIAVAAVGGCEWGGVGGEDLAKARRRMPLRAWHFREGFRREPVREETARAESLSDDLSAEIGSCTGDEVTISTLRFSPLGTEERKESVAGEKAGALGKARARLVAAPAVLAGLRADFARTGLRTM
jgi:hypothetical protein